MYNNVRLKEKECELISILNIKYYFGVFTYKKYLPYCGNYACMNKKGDLFISHFKPKNYKTIKYF